MAEIAVLGYGTVGSGVVDVLRRNQISIDRKASQPIRVKYIFDARDFPGSPDERLVTHNIDDVLNDNDVKIIVEAIGGVEPAYTYVKKALMRGKSVCTSNKELVAKHGAELLSIARDGNINFLFEASVGGGIPIIRPLNLSLTADEIYEISGILNGTTNFILTRIQRDGGEFAASLKAARDLGYAESDPTADVDGWDSCRKLAILVSLAIGKQVDYEHISTEGISRITGRDAFYAARLNAAIKLIATARIIDNGVYAWVAPTLVPDSHPLYAVNDVYNAIYIKGNVIGEVMFYGLGAGKYPTASSVVADVVDAVKNLNRNIMHFWSTEKHNILGLEELKSDRFIRVGADDTVKALSAVTDVFNDARTLQIFDDEIGFVAKDISETELMRRLGVLSTKDGVGKTLCVLRAEGGVK